MLKRSPPAVSFVLFLILFFSQSVYSSYSCYSLFEADLEFKTIEDYLGQIEDRHSLRKQPRFVSPNQEIELEKEWSSEDVPKLIQEALPPGAGAINHALYQSQPGVVKIDGTGLMVSVRANLEYKGKNLGTNAAVSSNALFANLGNSEKYLARKDAKAVIIFLHGGGTKSTGHHVAANMMNYMGSYGIDVIAIDQPWHGEGPRHFFNDADEYFDYLLEFFKKYVPPNVPIYVSGHSMGGTYADMLLRRSDRNPKIKEVVKGIIALSNVPDLAPGGSYDDKVNAEREREKDPKIKENMVGEDKFLMESLVEKAKVSPVASYDIQNMFADNDWTLPADKGAGYLPSIHIIGDQDFLYTGLKEHFEKYVGVLAHGRLIVYPNVGHIIFSDDTTFDHIRDFVSQLNGKPLQKITNVRGSSKTGMIQRLIETYLNNLAFREFVADFEIIHKSGKGSINLMKERLTLLNQYLAQVNLLKKKNKQITDQEIESEIPRPHKIEYRGQAEVKFQDKRLTDEEIRQEIAYLESMFKSAYIPEDGYGEFAKKNILRRDEISVEILQLSKDRVALKDQVDKLAISKKRLEKQMLAMFQLLQRKSWGRELSPEEEQIFKTMKIPVKLGSALQASEDALEELMALYNKINELNAEYIGKLIKEGRRNEQALMQIPRDIADLYQDYQSKEKRYQLMVKETEDIFYKEAGGGHINENIQKLSRDLYETTKSWETLGDKLYSMEINILKLNHERTSLLRTYVELISPNMFYFEEIQLIDLLNLDYVKVQDWLGSLETAWKNWSTLWREKPQTDAGGLY